MTSEEQQCKNVQRIMSDNDQSDEYEKYCRVICQAHYSYYTNARDSIFVFTKIKLHT